MEVIPICRDLADYFHYVTQIQIGERAARVSTMGRVIRDGKVAPVSSYPKCYYKTDAYCGDDWDLLQSLDCAHDPLPVSFIEHYYGLQTDSLAIAQHDRIVAWVARRLQEEWKR